MDTVTYTGSFVRFDTTNGTVSSALNTSESGWVDI